MLALVHILDANTPGTRARLALSLGMLQEMSSKPCYAHGLEGWARLALAHGDPEKVARILGGIVAHMKTLSMTMIPLEQAVYDQTLAVVKQRLDATTFENEFSAGEKLKVEQAIELAMR